ncbi:MAG: helix-turn-helix domain-containing protein [Actinomycetota bacterium]
MEVLTNEGDGRAGAIPLLVEIKEVAHFLRISRSKVYVLMNSGELPSVRIGSRRLVRRVDLERFVSELSAA